MKYILDINFFTDGDFGFPYIPRDMRYDRNYRYSLYKEYENKEEAITDTLDIINFLERNVRFGNMNKDTFYDVVRKFKEELKDKVEMENISIVNSVYGNQDIELRFFTEPNSIKLEIPLSDKEYETINGNFRNIPRESMESIVAEINRRIIEILEEPLI